MFLEIPKQLSGPVLTELHFQWERELISRWGAKMSSGINAMKKNTAGMGGACGSREDRKPLQGVGIGADP